MNSTLRRTPGVLVAIIGTLLVGGVVTFAQHIPAFARLLYAPAHAVAQAIDHPQAMATNRPLVRILLSGIVERDSKQLPIEKAGPVKPGEVVRFTLSSVNEGSAPAREYRAVGQIPRGTTLIPNSAFGDRLTQVMYSIDNGKVFSKVPLIDQKQPDGTVKKVAAPISMYTQVRFEWSDPLVAGGKVSASYQVRVQ
jgi:uncharacterized repeat protein (TIGR01451 family)